MKKGTVHILVNQINKLTSVFCLSLLLLTITSRHNRCCGPASAEKPLTMLRRNFITNKRAVIKKKLTLMCQL